MFAACCFFGVCCWYRSFSPSLRFGPRTLTSFFAVLQPFAMKDCLRGLNSMLPEIKQTASASHISLDLFILPRFFATVRFFGFVMVFAPFALKICLRGLPPKLSRSSKNDPQIAKNAPRSPKTPLEHPKRSPTWLKITFCFVDFLLFPEARFRRNPRISFKT